MKQSSLKQPGQVQSINGFTKSDMDLVNKYCMKFGYKPDFKSNLIYDAERCHKSCLLKDNGAIYAISVDGRKVSLRTITSIQRLKIRLAVKDGNSIKLSEMSSVLYHLNIQNYD